MRAAAPGDQITLTLLVKTKTEEGRRVTLEARALDARGDLAMRGELEVIAPQEKVTVGAVHGQPVETREKGRRYRRLMEMARRLPPLRTAVVHPVDEASLTGALESHREGLIEAVLLGPEARIRLRSPKPMASTCPGWKSSPPSTATPRPIRASPWRAPARSRRS